MVFTTVNPGMTVMASEENEVVEQTAEEAAEQEEEITDSEEAEDTEFTENPEDDIVVEDSSAEKAGEDEEQLLMVEEETAEGDSQAVAVYADKSWSIDGETSYTIEKYYGTTSNIEVKVNNSENVPLHYKWEQAWYIKEDGQFGDYEDAYSEVENEPAYVQAEWLDRDMKYRCTVSDDMGNKELVEIYVKCINTLQINNKATWKEIAVKLGGTLTLKAEAVSTMADATLTYKWSSSLTDGVLGTGPVYTKENFGVNDAGGFYRCEISDGYSTDIMGYYVTLDSGLKINAPKHLEVENGETRTFSVSATTDMNKLEIQVYKFNPEQVSWTELKDADLSRITVAGTEEIQVFWISADDGVNDYDAYTVVGPKALLNGTSGTPENAKLLNEGIEERAVIIDDIERAYFKFIPKKAGKWTFYSTGVYSTAAEIYHSKMGDMKYESGDAEGQNFKITADLKANEVYYIETSFAGFSYDSMGSFKVKAELVSRTNCQHQWGESVTTKNATCTEDGISVKRCVSCGEEESSAIPKQGHTFGAYSITTPPTAVAAGVQTRTCSVCGYSESAEVAKLKANVTLSATSLPLQVKQSASLSKLIKSMTTGDKLVSCSSSNKKVATVSKTGKVTGKKAGTAKITMKFASGLSKTVTVKVQKAKVAAAKISNLPVSITLKVKKTYKLSPVVTPLTTKEKATYKTADKKIAAVSKNGTITAKKAGKTTITVQVGKKTKKVKVTVKKK